MATGGVPELDPDLDLDLPAKSEHISEFLWNVHSKVTEHLKAEYDLEFPANRRINKDLKYHADQCAILTNLAKQRDQNGPPEFWTPQAWNSWMETAWKACEAWEMASSDLYGKLENPLPLVEELTRLQKILEIWAKIDPAPSPARPILECTALELPVPGRVSTSEQISISTQPSQVLTPSRTPTVRLMYDTGARPKAPDVTPHLADDFRRMFRLSEDRLTASQPETEVQKEAPSDPRMPPRLVRPREVPARASVSQRSSTPLEPMASTQEQTGLYTSVEERENQTLEVFKSMSILSNDARDSSSLNIRTGGLQ